MEIKDILNELYKLDDRISKCESKKEALDYIEELIVKYSDAGEIEMEEAC